MLGGQKNWGSKFVGVKKFCDKNSGVKFLGGAKTKWSECDIFQSNTFISWNAYNFFLNQYFWRGLKVVPPQKFSIFGFLNQVNIYLGKVTNFRGILFNKIWRNSRIPLGGVESTPPPVANRGNDSHMASQRLTWHLFGVGKQNNSKFI